MRDVAAIKRMNELKAEGREVESYEWHPNGGHPDRGGMMVIRYTAPTAPTAGVTPGGKKI